MDVNASATTKWVTSGENLLDIVKSRLNLSEFKRGGYKFVPFILKRMILFNVPFIEVELNIVRELFHFDFDTDSRD
jgi:hypothetical protein